MVNIYLAYMWLVCWHNMTLISIYRLIPIVLQSGMAPVNTMVIHSSLVLQNRQLLS
jgi:hypothetical protein